MDLKVKLYKHKLQAIIDDDLPKVISYFKPHGVNVIFSIEETAILMPNAPTQLFQPNDGLFDVVMYMFNRGDFQMTTNGLTFPVSKTLVGIYLATSIPDDNLDYTWKSISHELMHALFYKFTGAGGNVPMDLTVVNGTPIPYYKNDDPNAPDGNFAQAWVLLDPYIKALQSPTMPPDEFKPDVVIIRFKDGNQTQGFLNARRTSVNFSCYTLELPYINNMPNISAIPTGNYQVKWTFSWKLLKYTYEVQNVKGRSGIRLHAANFYYNLQGCIALGSEWKDINNDGKLDLLNSQNTLKLFEQYMNYQPFNLQIK